MVYQIDKLKQQAKDKEAELMTLLGRKPVEIWNEDLDKFVEEWEVGDCIFLLPNPYSSRSIELVSHLGAEGRSSWHGCEEGQA